MKDDREMPDLSVDGPGSPISVKKVLENVAMSPTGVHVFIDQNASGFDLEGSDYMEITTEECKRQAVYFKENHFDGERMPFYLLKYLYYFYFDDSIFEKAEDIPGLTKYFSEDEKGKTEYKTLLNTVKYCDKNHESAHLIGLIQGLCGMLKMARDHGSPPRLFIQHPESHLHPSRAAKLMTFTYKVRAEYGFKD